MLNMITGFINLFLVMYCLVMGIWALFDPSVGLPAPAIVWAACALAFGRK